MSRLGANAFFALSWLSWVVLLGGVAALQAKCEGYPFKVPTLVSETELAAGCRSARTTAWIWWATWLDLFVLLLLSLSQCCCRRALALTKQTFLSMSTMVLMLAADSAVRTIGSFGGGLQSAAIAVLVAAIVILICNLLMLMFFGGDLAAMLQRKSKDQGPHLAALLAPQAPEPAIPTGSGSPPAGNPFA